MYTYSESMIFYVHAYCVGSGKWATGCWNIVQPHVDVSCCSVVVLVDRDGSKCMQFLSENLKRKVYRRNPQTVEEN